MSDIKDILDLEDEELEFDPLEVDDDIIDQENMDDDNPYDTIDYPTMREMPPDPHAGATFTPEVKGSPEAAMLSLFDHNPARRTVFLALLDTCQGGCKASLVKEKVKEVQEDNFSVFDASTLCRMLESAGGLRLTKPVVTEAVEDVEDGVEYLEIKERIDPIWTTTPEGEAVLESETQGRYFWEIMDRDDKYLQEYCDVLEFVKEKPRKVTEIAEIIDSRPIVQNPRRFGAHFVDMLERTDAIIWKNKAWTITDLGLDVLPKLKRMTLKAAGNGSIEGTED